MPNQVFEAASNLAGPGVAADVAGLEAGLEAGPFAGLDAGLEAGPFPGLDADGDSWALGDPTTAD